MFLEIHVPSYPLRQFVKSMIYYRDYTADSPFEKLLPDGNAQLIIELDGEYRRIQDTNQQSHLYFRSAWITGIQTKPVIYHSEQHASTLCIQFEADGLHALLGIPATEVSDKMIDASLLLGRSVIQLREYLLDCDKPFQIFNAAADYLKQRLIVSKAERNIVNYIAKNVCLENLSHTEMSRKSGYSRKHLIQVFKKHVGLSPKKYQRIFRFNRALSLLHSANSPIYADIAAQCLYFDQSHFSKEFGLFAGTTPGSYQKSNLLYPHVIPIGRDR